MVLERVFGRSLLQKQPDVALFIGFIFTLIGFVTSYLIFFSGMSVAMIGFSSLLILPYIMKIMKPESSEYTSVFSKESPSLRFFASLFIGMALAYTILFAILKPGFPPQGVRDAAFETQLGIIQGNIAGDFAAGMFGLPKLFYDIVTNNMILLFVILALSFFYGAGVVFALSYNASIAGIVYGWWLNALIWPQQGRVLFPAPLFYLPHTILEILAYVLIAIAGIAISKPSTRKNTNPIRRDFLILTVASVILILVGGLVEVTVPRLAR